MELKPYTSKSVPERGHINAEEKIASLFEPDTLLAAQYFDNLRRKTILEPEKRLVLAVLEDAINCFQDNVFSESVRAKKLFNRRKNGSWMKAAIGYSPFEMFVSIWGLTLITCAGDCCDGKKRNWPVSPAAAFGKGRGWPAKQAAK